MFLFGMKYMGDGLSLAAGARMKDLLEKLTRKPVLGFLMPALFNGLLVGWELSMYVGGGFWVNALCVAAGEVLALRLGVPLYFALKKARINFQ